MPELPEVESLRRFVEDTVVGRSITRCELAAFSALKTFAPPLDALIGRTITGAERKGKYLGFVTSSAGDPEPLLLIIHLARGGWMRWRTPLAPARAKPGKGPMALRLGLDDDNGFDITEAGTEKRLALWVVRAMDEVPQAASLGPDPLASGVDVDHVAEILRSQTGQIKKVLVDQQVIAGVGNAYSDEALYVAKLSPFKNASKLTEDEALRLADAVIEVLREALARSADAAVADLKSEKKAGLRVHAREGQTCPVCGDTIRSVSFATKSLQYCPTCQTGGKPLADRRMSRLLK